MTSLVDRLLPEELWHPSGRCSQLHTSPRGGVPRRVPDRNCVAALGFMARTSAPWSLLPAKELGCGSATTCWRRFAEWAKAGVVDQLQAPVLEELGGRPHRPGTGQRRLLQPAAVKGDLTGAHSVDRGKQESSCTWPASAAGCRCR